MANFFIRMINYIIAGIGEALTWLLNLLPDSPFSTPAAAPGSINLGYISWLIPFPTMIVHLVALLGAISIYYVVRVAARWIKVARS